MNHGKIYQYVQNQLSRAPSLLRSYTQVKNTLAKVKDGYGIVISGDEKLDYVDGIIKLPLSYFLLM